MGPKAIPGVFYSPYRSVSVRPQYPIEVYGLVRTQYRYPSFGYVRYNLNILVPDTPTGSVRPNYRYPTLQ